MGCDTGSAMRALRLVSPGQIAIQDVPVPEIEADEVLVRAPALGSAIPTFTSCGRPTPARPVSRWVMRQPGSSPKSGRTSGR